MDKVPLKILIVEDNEADLELILRELKKGDIVFTHKHCETEEDFKKSLLQFQPDLILSDHNLPSFSSTDALIEARRFNPLIPFILVSGFIGEEEAVDMIVNKGANDFILKDNLLRLNPAIIREFKNFKLRFELKKTTDRLKQLSMVANHTHNGVIISNSNGEIEWVNEAYVKMTGYTLNECYGRKPGDILQGRDTDQNTVKRIRKKLKKGQPFREEILNYHKNGKPYWIKLDVTPVFDSFGTLTNFIGIQENITSEKEHEQLMVAINDIATSLLDTESFADICNTITEKLIHHFGFEDCVIYEVDQQNEQLIQVAATGEKRSDKKTINDPLFLKFGEGIVGSVALSKKSEIVTDTTQDSRYIIDNQKRHSELAVPILLDKEVIGVIDSEHPDKNFYTELHLRQFETIAGVIASKFKAAQENRQKRLIEEELKKSETKLSQITSNIDAAVHRYEITPDGKGKLTYVSPRSKDIYEIDPEEALVDDTLLWEQIHPDDMEYVNSIFEEAIKDKKKNVFHIIYRITTPSGKKKWIEVSGTVSYKEDGTFVSDTINKDITSRVESEQAIAKSEQLLSSLTNNIPGVIIRFRLNKDETNQIEYISKRAEEIYELSDSEIIENNSKLWGLIFPEDVAEMMPTIYESANKLTSWFFEYRIKTKSGEVKWLSASGSPRKGDNDSVIWDTVVLDITNEKKYQESLARSNYQLSEAQELAKIGDWSIDLISGETYVSPIVKKIYEVEHDFKMEEGITFYKEGYHRERIQEVVNKTIEDGIPYSEDLIIITGKGKEKWVRAQGEADIVDKKCVRIHGTLMDIDTRKKAEIELQKNNERLINAQKLARIGDWSVNLETNETFISPIIRKIHEVDKDYPWDIDTGLKFFKEGFNRKRKEYLVSRAINEGLPYNEELIIVTAQGNERWVQTIGEAVIKDGVCVGLNGTLMDITEERILRDSLKENQIRLDTAIKGANLGVWDTNVKEDTFTINDRWFEMLGYNRDEVDDPYTFFFEIIHPEDADLVVKEIEKIETSEKDSFEVVIRVKSKSGEYKTILDKGTALEYDSDGKISRIIGTHLDITEQIELQKDLESSISEKTVLLAEIHHRVKNNLAIVSGLLDLKAFESENKVLKETLFDMGQRIKSIAGVHELLYEGETYSDIQMDLYLNKLIKNINTSLLGEKNVNFKISIDSELTININQAVPIGLLLNELITNSFKYAFSEVQKPIISFSIKKKENHFDVLYFDNGPGIDTSEIKNPSSLGTTLINTLLSQLNAEYKISNQTGFKLSFSFEEQKVGAHSNLRK